jgi:hypothetical protein
MPAGLETPGLPGNAARHECDNTFLCNHQSLRPCLAARLSEFLLVHRLSHPHLCSWMHLTGEHCRRESLPDPVSGAGETGCSNGGHQQARMSSQGRNRLLHLRPEPFHRGGQQARGRFAVGCQRHTWLHLITSGPRTGQATSQAEDAGFEVAYIRRTKRQTEELQPYNGDSKMCSDEMRWEISGKARLAHKSLAVAADRW